MSSITTDSQEIDTQSKQRELERMAPTKSPTSQSFVMSPSSLIVASELIAHHSVGPKGVVVRASSLAEVISGLFPETDNTMRTIQRLRSQHSDDKKFIELAVQYEDVMKHIVKKLMSGELTLFEESVSFRNEKLNEDYSNIARNVKLLLFHLLAVEEFVKDGKDSFASLIEQLEASLLTNGYFAVELIDFDNSVKVTLDESTPVHLTKSIRRYLLAITNELRVRQQHSKVESLLKISEIFKNFVHGGG